MEKHVDPFIRERKEVFITQQRERDDDGKGQIGSDAEGDTDPCGIYSSCI